MLVPQHILQSPHRPPHLLHPRLLSVHPPLLARTNIRQSVLPVCGEPLTDSCSLTAFVNIFLVLYFFLKMAVDDSAQLSVVHIGTVTVFLVAGSLGFAVDRT